MQLNVVDNSARRTGRLQPHPVGGRLASRSRASMVSPARFRPLSSLQRRCRKSEQFLDRPTMTHSGQPSGQGRCPWPVPWIACDARTKLIPAFTLGSRTQALAHQFDPVSAMGGQGVEVEAIAREHWQTTCRKHLRQGMHNLKSDVQGARPKDRLEDQLRGAVGPMANHSQASGTYPAGVCNIGV